MAIAGYDENRFSEFVKEHFTPSKPIEREERLLGRSNELKLSRRALRSPGRQVLIHGDRGVGKSSIALTTAYQVNSSDCSPILIACSKSDTFSSIIKSIARQTLDAREVFERGASASKVDIDLKVLKHTSGARGDIRFPNPKTVNDALEVMRFVGTTTTGVRVIVIDELERMTKINERQKFGELIKNLSLAGENVRFIFSGIQVTVKELLDYHESAGRNVESILVAPLPFDQRDLIVETACEDLGLHLSHPMRRRIQQICDGYPHFAHLIGETLMYILFDEDDEVTTITSQHFNMAINQALGRAEAELIQLYEQATLKATRAKDYEEALWSLADSSSDRRQIKDIYEASYQKIMSQRLDRDELDRDGLSQRLHSLRKPTHGQVVVNYGAGNFGFRENRFRGYVRLVAHKNGIELGDHLFGMPRSAR